MRKILLATDLSAHCHWALERSLLLADALSAPLTILHVVDEDLPDGIAAHHLRAAAETIRDRVETLPTSKDVDVEVLVVPGRPAQAIVRIAEEAGIDFIVLGGRREQRFADMFRGTTAERILRCAGSPVLVATKPVRNPYRRVLVGVDFSIVSRRAIEFAVGLLPAAQYFLVHAYDVPFAGFLHGDDTEAAISEQHERTLTTMINEEMSVLEREHGGVAPLFQRVICRGRAPEVIRAEVERLCPDLLVVGTHGRAGVAHAIIGSVAEDLLASPPCDAMAVKAW